MLSEDDKVFIRDLVQKVDELTVQVEELIRRTKVYEETILDPVLFN